MNHGRFCLIPFLCLVQQILMTAASSAANWTKPNGKLPSFTDSYTVGERIILSWQPLNQSFNDLWLTRYDTATDDFALRLNSRFHTLAVAFSVD